MRLSGKVAIVTGSGQGIGAEIARTFAREGASVTLAARTQEKIKDVAEEIRQAGGQALAIQTDIREVDQVERMVVSTVETFGRLDILVNNAGIPAFVHQVDGPLERALSDFDDVMNTNVRGGWLAIHFAVPYMKAVGGGSIIQIGSVHGKAGASMWSAYAASKGALDAMTRALAIELAPYKIRVNSCNPGAIDVSKGRLKQALLDLGEIEKAKQIEALEREYRELNQPLHIVGEPRDVAWACVYLASDESRYVTGVSLMVDGGLTALLGEPSRLERRSFEVLEEYRKAVRAAVEYLRQKNIDF